jgi:DNA (cytosine-5)-methyltransferase 1
LAEKFDAIDIFAGIGCASMGFKKAGFNIKAALEIKSLRCDNYEKNLGFRPIEEDVSSVTGEEILSYANLKKKEGFCMIGCPPCQSFSSLSETRGIDAITDPRSKYVIKFAKLVEEMKPTVVIFENVPGMLQGPGKIHFEKYYRKLKKAGYKTIFDIVNAADYGVPQNRRRLLAISSSASRNLSMPKKIAETNRDKKFYPKTVREAIGDLPKLEAGETDPKDPFHKARLHTEKVMRMIKKIPKDGGGRKDLPYRLWLPCHKALVKKGAESVYGRMRWDTPSNTITCRCVTPSSGRFLHPEQDRGITLREAARLQTIPDNFHLIGTTKTLEQMIGDAVPVNLARRIAYKVADIMSS